MRVLWVGIWLGLIGFVCWVPAQAPREFSLKVLEVRGTVEAQLPGGEQKRVKASEKLPAGSTVSTQPKSSAILEWLPYKARVKLAPETKIQLSTTRALSLQNGRIWVGTPPLPMGERRFPLPVQCKRVHIVGSPDAIFSCAFRPNRGVIVSVDEGRVFVSTGQKTIVVPRSHMVVITPENDFVGPMPMTKQEQLMWDMGGTR